MNLQMRRLRKDKTVFSAFVLSMFGMIISFIFLVFSYRSLPVLVPLFNQLPWGTDRLTDRAGLYIPYAVGLVFIVCNIFFSVMVYEKMPLISRMMAVANVLISFSVSYFLIRTVLLVL